jgi:hypothetical protein
MKRNSLILSLILTIGVAVAHPAAGIAQSHVRTLKHASVERGNDLYNDGTSRTPRRSFARH